MRICIFTPYFLPGIGGVELSLHYLATHLGSLGHKVSVLTGSGPKVPSGTLNPSGYSVYSWHDFSFPLIRKENKRYEKNLFVNLSLHWSREPFDVLNAHFAYPTGYIAALWSQNRFPAVVITSQGVDVQKIDALNQYGYRHHKETAMKIRTALALADLATGVGPQIVKDTVEAGSRQSKTILIPNGIAMEELKHPGAPPFDFPYILSLGRLHPLKGMDLLLKSFQRVCRHDKSIKLVITGSGPSIHSLVEQALTSGIGDRVIFTGIKTGPDKAALFQHCRFFLCPSRIEAMGCAIIEALVCGKPVISFRVGGNPDIIKDGVNGFLITPYDTALFADHILNLLINPDIVHRMGDAGEKIARNYSWPIIARRYVDAYKKALENKAKKRTSAGGN